MMITLILYTFQLVGLAFTILGIIVLVGAAFLMSYIEELLAELPSITGSIDLLGNCMLVLDLK